MQKPRLPKNRRASVLIIVIVLLLLLAILGAAYISTSRGDRLSSAQSVLNAQTDADTQGIADLVAGTIADDLNDYVQFNDMTGNPPTPVTTYSDNLRYPVTLHAGTTTIYRNSYLGTFNSAFTYYSGDVVSVTPIANGPAVFYVCTAIGGTSATPPGGVWLITNRWPGVTAAGIDGDGLQPWLADRIPTLNGAGAPMWQNITQALVTLTGATAPVATSILGTLTAANTTTFESPDGTTVPAAQQYSDMVPTALTGNTPAPAGAVHDPNLANDGTNVPALNFANTNVIAGDADNDGIADCLLFRIPGAYFDGLTWYAGVRIIDNNSAINVNTAFSRDSDYPLTVTITGTNTAAPTAWGSPPANPAATIPNYYGLFQAGVGLWELLASTGDTTASYAPMPDQLDKLLGYNLNTTVGTSTADGFGQPLDESTLNVPNGAVSNQPIPRTDYEYITLQDALYHGLGRRPANPAINYYTGTASPYGYFRYRALPLSDEAALASHFCLKTTNSSGNPQSLIEQLLLASLWTNAYPVGSYDPSNVSGANGWFTQNFTYPAPGSTAAFPLRPLLVTRNPVSNYTQPVFDALNIGEPINPRMLPWGAGNNYATGTTTETYNHYKGIWNSATAYIPNDIVAYPVNYTPGGGPTAFTFAGPGTGNPPTPGYSFTYICVSPNTDQTPLNAAANTNGANPMSVNSGFWHLQPWTNHPVKTNVNTAPFAELFRAFWCVMAGNPAGGINQPPFNNGVSVPVPVGVPGPWDYNPYDPTASYPPPPAAPTPSSGQSSSYRWHQFRSPLRDPTTSSGTPPNNPGTANVVWMDPTNVAVLRSAIAAVNTLGLRDQSQNVISRQVPIQVYNATTAQMTPSANTWNAEATVFSAAPQPFITEVFATNDPGLGPEGYVGIELYNPYPFAMTLNNWWVAVIDRSPPPANAGTYPEMAVTQLSAYPLNVQGAAVKIPAYSYALLENLPVTGDTNTGPGDAVSRPGAILNPNVPLNGPLPNAILTHVYVNNLQNVMAGGTGAGPNGGEFVLLRPRRADGTFTSSTDPFNNYTEAGANGPNLYDLVPVDSYDFTGLAHGGALVAWSYIRQKPGPATAPNPPTQNLFLATNGGVYIGNALSGNPRQRVTVTGQQYPTEVEASDGVGAFTTMAPSLGQQFPTTTNPTTPPYPPFPPMQIYNTNNVQATIAAATGATSPNALELAYNQPRGGPQAYPFGGFARNGDMLNIPFVGAYRIRSGTYVLPNAVLPSGAPNPGAGLFAPDNPTSVVEMNALPMDCAFADDGDSYTVTGTTVTYSTTADDAYENVGRFYPTTARVQQVATGNNAPPPLIPTTDDYFWARRLFDYLTVQSNDDNFMPNFDPGPRDNYLATADVPPLSPQTYFAGPVTQVYNADGAAPDQTNQDNVGVEGLININTASAQVLSLLPLVTKGDGSTNTAADCLTMAQAIVAYRNANGPFMSIFDLNKVAGFQTATGAYGKINIGTANNFSATGNTPGATNAVNTNNGLLTPPDTAFPSASATAGTSANNLTEDFQSDNAVLDRISNMITTRSDTFTVYIVVEGWQNAILPGQTYNAGPPAAPLPQLKVVRHYAFIADRSAINQDLSTRFLRTLTVPNN